MIIYLSGRRGHDVYLIGDITFTSPYCLWESRAGGSAGWLLGAGSTRMALHITSQPSLLCGMQPIEWRGRVRSAPQRGAAYPCLQRGSFFVHCHSTAHIHLFADTVTDCKGSLQEPSGSTADQEGAGAASSSSPWRAASCSTWHIISLPA